MILSSPGLTVRSWAPGQAGRRQHNMLPSLLPRLQLAWRGEQLRRAALDEAGHFHRRLGLAEVEFLDSPGAFFDLVGGDQDLADVFVGLREMVLQLEHAFA